MRRASLLATFAALALTSCASGGPSAAELCTNALREGLPAEEFTGDSVTENLDRGSAAIDIRGSYDGGTFACGLERMADGGITLHQAIVYYDNGNADTVINGGEPQPLLGRQ
jgi:hypothetical protein